MKNIRVIAVFVLSVFSVSCMDRNLAAKFDAAEFLMNEKPDSALSIIRSVDSLSLKNKSDKARYSLLYGMAYDKTYKNTTDSKVLSKLLSPAISWYSKHGSADEKMKILFYQGEIAQYEGDGNAAAVYYSRAEKLAGSVKDKHALGLLYLADATLYYTVYNYQKSAELEEKGLAVLQEAGDPLYNMALGQLAVSCFSLKDWDRADSLFRAGINAVSSDLYAKSVFLSNYSRMQVLRPTPDPESALAMLDIKRNECGSPLTLQEAGTYAYALVLVGRYKEAEPLIAQLEKLTESSPTVVESWLSRCALAAGDFEKAYRSLSRARIAEDKKIHDALSNSFASAIADDNEKIARQRREHYLICISILALSLLSLLLILILIIRKKNRIDENRNHILDICAKLKKEEEDQEAQATDLSQQLNHFREEARQERIKRFRQAGRLQTALWRLDRLGVPSWYQKSSDMVAIKEELAFIYDIDDSGEKLARRLDKELGGSFSRLIKSLNLENKPDDILFLCCYLLDLPSDIVASKFGITPNYVRVKRHRLKSQIAALNNEEFKALFP